MTARNWLCTLSDGDLITIQWSGQLRTVAVVVTGEDLALRDLTESEMRELEAAAREAEAGR